VTAEGAYMEKELTFEKWFDLWDTTHDPEVRRLCGIAWRAQGGSEKEKGVEP
jgi:hypothetical protein